VNVDQLQNLALLICGLLFLVFVLSRR